MGIFDRKIKRSEPDKKTVEQYFKMLTAYAPAYSTYQGSVYEMGLTRAAIHAYAKHCAKLSPKVLGSAIPQMEKILTQKPNPLMDTYSFIYKLASIVKVENTAFIIPIFESGATGPLVGFWPLRSQGTQVISVNNELFLKYDAPGQVGRKLVIELAKVGILRNHYYDGDIYGNSNSAIDTTLNLLYTQDQGIIYGVKASANIRFLARLAAVLNSASIKTERDRLVADNLTAENNNGVMMFDGKYADIKQIESKQMLIDDKQTALIQNNVFNYFGVSENILQNKFTEEEWNAYYEGEIESFAIQLSLVMSNMNYTSRELSQKNGIMFEANRLQYASNTTKISLVTQLFDRGFLTHNQGLEIFNMSPLPDGDKHYIRREYAEVTKLGDDVVVTPADEPAKEPVGDKEVPDDNKGQTV